MKLAPSVRRKAERILDQMAEIVKNCGTGSGGFKPGNSCGRGGRVSGKNPPAGGGTLGATEFSGKPHNPDGKDTEQKFKRPDGTWTPERQVLHDKIIAHFLAGATPVKNPVATMMGGGPASGKSSAIDAGHVKIPKNHVAIDADEIKKHIPEYNKGVAAKDLSAASFAHEESSYLSKRILQEASKKSLNVMLDGTGDSGIDSLKKKVDIMRANGAKVVANYVTVDTKEALRRNAERAKETGRMPPESMVREVHATVSRVVPEAIKRGLFDEFKLVDTNTGSPVVVATAVGKGLTIHNQALWDRFLAKGV